MAVRTRAALRGRWLSTPAWAASAWWVRRGLAAVTVATTAATGPLVSWGGRWTGLLEAAGWPSLLGVPQSRGLSGVKGRVWGEPPAGPSEGSVVLGGVG